MGDDFFLLVWKKGDTFAQTWFPHPFIPRNLKLFLILLSPSPTTSTQSLNPASVTSKLSHKQSINSISTANPTPSHHHL